MFRVSRFPTVFRSVYEAFEYVDQKGYFQPHSLFGS
jgi:hypothetical protein